MCDLMKTKASLTNSNLKTTVKKESFKNGGFSISTTNLIRFAVLKTSTPLVAWIVEFLDIRLLIAGCDRVLAATRAQDTGQTACPSANLSLGTC